jgi:anti-sigma B factor antagonist
MTQLGGDRLDVDGRGIRPPRAYGIDERPAPGGAVVLALEGELDLAAAPAVRERFEAVRDGGARAVVVDLDGVEFLDSSMLRELLLADAALRQTGGGLVLAAARRPVIRLLELTRTTELLAVAPTVEEALERVAG